MMKKLIAVLLLFATFVLMLGSCGMEVPTEVKAENETDVPSQSTDSGTDATERASESEIKTEAQSEDATEVATEEESENTTEESTEKTSERPSSELSETQTKEEKPSEEESKTDEDSEIGEVDDFKIGFIFLHDERSAYDSAFIDAANEMKTTMKLKDSQVVFKMNIAEDYECADVARALVDQGCDIIFANSFGHENYLLQVAKENPSVQFCHASGIEAHTEGLANFHNAYAAIYEGRFLAGVAAGMKLNEMIAQGKITAEEAVIGYVGAFPYAEVVSAYTAFFLGARYVCPTATMKVRYANSWYDEADEKTLAQALVFADKCVLISQHADSMGAPSACEAMGVPNVAYNGSTVASCPDTFIVSSAIDWTPYFVYIVSQYAKGEPIAADWCGGLAEGAVVLSEINSRVAAEGTDAKLAILAEKIESGDLKVFDTDTFTLDGKKVTSYCADVDSDVHYASDTQVIVDGCFKESFYRSAPYFDLRIDGILEMNSW